MVRVRTAAFIAIFLAAFVVTGAHAEVPVFSNLVSSQVNDITTDFASNLMHTSASPPSSLERFGFELGAVAGATKPRRLSGIAGSNLQALIDAIGAGRLKATLVGVFSDQADAFALDRARDLWARRLRTPNGAPG